MNYSMKTFGCKVNTYDSSLIQKKLNEESFQEIEQEGETARYHVVNTCAVTQTAVKESLKWIRYFRRKNPKTAIVVTGCGPQVQLLEYSKSREVDLVIANSHKSQLSEILKKHKKGLLKSRVFHSNIFKNTDKGEGGAVESRHTRLFLKIQDGCNQFCTFCVIPFARGKSRSLSAEHLKNQINEAFFQGVLEVVLTGVHIGDYKDPDSGQGLDYLVQKILKETKIPRIRLSSLEPIELTDSLFSLYEDDRMCPHFHISLQSGSSKILKNMKRKYSQKDVRYCLEKIYKRNPQTFVGMDVIAGFPGESQQDFEDTYELLKNSPWTKMHIFPYSPRPSTYALRREDHLPLKLITKRAFLLRALSCQRFNERARAEVGRSKYILPLKKGALSRDYWPVCWDKKNSSPAEYKVQLTSWDEKEKKFHAEELNKTCLGK